MKPNWGQQITKERRGNHLHYVQYFSQSFYRYKLAEDLNAQLDSMANTLKDLVAKLNAAQEKAVDTENPVCNIFFCIRCLFFILDLSNRQDFERSFEFPSMGGSKYWSIIIQDTRSV
jgi:hypothetical protein